MGNLHHLYVPTRNWYICWNENVPHYASQGFPLCREKYPHHSPEIFYQLLSTNWYFLNTTLVVSHTHTHTHTHPCMHAYTHIYLHMHIHHWRFHFHLWIFVSQMRSWAISIIWNFEWVIKTHLRKERPS